MIKEDKKNNMKLKDKNEENKKNKENKENKKSQENERKNGKYLHLYLGDLFSNRRTFSPLNEYESKDYKKKKEEDKNNSLKILEEDNKIEGSINNKLDINILKKNFLFNNNIKNYSNHTYLHYIEKDKIIKKFINFFIRKGNKDKAIKFFFNNLLFLKKKFGMNPIIMIKYLTLHYLIGYKVIKKQVGEKTFYYTKYLRIQKQLNYSVTKIVKLAFFLKDMYKMPVWKTLSFIILNHYISKITKNKRKIIPNSRYKYSITNPESESEGNMKKKRYYKKYNHYNKNANFNKYKSKCYKAVKKSIPKLINIYNRLDLNKIRQLKKKKNIIKTSKYLILNKRKKKLNKLSKNNKKISFINYKNDFFKKKFFKFYRNVVFLLRSSRIFFLYKKKLELLFKQYNYIFDNYNHIIYNKLIEISFFFDRFFLIVFIYNIIKNLDFIHKNKDIIINKLKKQLKYIISLYYDLVIPCTFTRKIYKYLEFNNKLDIFFLSNFNMKEYIGKFLTSLRTVFRLTQLLSIRKKLNFLHLKEDKKDFIFSSNFMHSTVNMSKLFKRKTRKYKSKLIHDLHDRKLRHRMIFLRTSKHKQQPKVY
jgi:hypothetical protein